MPQVSPPLVLAAGAQGTEQQKHAHATQAGESSAISCRHALILIRKQVRRQAGGGAGGRRPEGGYAFDARQIGVLWAQLPKGVPAPHFDAG